MKLTLSSFTTPDGLKLPGLLYQPDKPTKRVALYLHGNGSSSVFYQEDRIDPMVKYLTDIGVAYFPFNNRGAHYVKRLENTKTKEKIYYGMAYELIEECVLDIDGAIDHLKTHGFEEFYLIGASTGANKIVVYDYLKKKNLVSKYVLLSGGDDTGLWHDMIGKKNFKATLDRAKKEVGKERGRSLIPAYIAGDMFMSWQSLYDTINPDGLYNIFPYNELFNSLKLSKKPLFKELKAISKPTQIIYGDKDEYCYGKVGEIVEFLKKLNKENFSVETILDGTHSFEGKEIELAQMITKFLK